MRAVNLLPSDLRGAAPKPARGGSRPEPVQGIGAYVVLGALALCVAALACYIVVNNGIKQRQADLETAKQQTTAATAKAAALKPYADFEALASARVETVRGLAAARFDWERSLRDLSRAMPADVKLQSLSGDIGLPGTASSSGSSDPLRGSIAAPAITIAGCATNQAATWRGCWLAGEGPRRGDPRGALQVRRRHRRRDRARRRGDGALRRRRPADLLRGGLLRGRAVERRPGAARRDLDVVGPGAQRHQPGGARRGPERRARHRLRQPGEPAPAATDPTAATTGTATSSTTSTTTGGTE